MAKKNIYPRAVSADHVLFDEAIEVYRSEDGNDFIEGDASIYYLLLSFEFEAPIETPLFSIMPPLRVNLHGGYSSLIAQVRQPKLAHYGRNHLLTIAMSAIISFVCQKIVKAPRGQNYEMYSEEEALQELYFQFPILTSGSGSEDISLSKQSISQIQSELIEVELLLNSIEYKDYVIFIQSIRLIQLSLLNKREDFALSYSLLIAAIESIAQVAIKREKISKKKVDKEKEVEWKAIADKNPAIKELFDLYKAARGGNQYLSERFVEFILMYCPVDTWEGLAHPNDNRNQYIKEKNGPAFDFDWTSKKQFDEFYPNDLNAAHIEKILSDSYKHRSNFLHRGESPPHRYPTNHTRYFEVIHSFSLETFDHIFMILPNYNLMAYIAKYSILNFFREKVKNKALK